MSVEIKDTKKVTSVHVRGRKEQPGAPKLIAITAYDYTFASLVDPLVDIVLVGDSLGMVIQGKPNTLSVTLDHVVYHTACVSRAVRHAHLVADMPFMSYQAGDDDALRNAGRLLAEGNAEAVKVEGGTVVARAVERMVKASIPVLGHIGLTPQSVHAFGGYRVQGKSDERRQQLLDDAAALEQAGAYAIVVEGVPSDLGREITERVKIPTIGIGAGRHCDGQILVSQDLLGMYPDFKPRFVKRYADVGRIVRDAVGNFAREVENGSFPDEEHSF